MFIAVFLLLCFMLFFLMASKAQAASCPPCTGQAHVTLVATGGTIAGTAPDATTFTDYTSGTLTAKELLEAVPELAEIAHIRTEQFSNIGSENMTLDNVLHLAKRVNALLLEESCTGIVITHGTDTLEETAYFLNLTVKSEKPVVLVGAMRPSTAISADGPLNLLHAVAVAASEASYGKGVMIVLNGQILSSREGTKSNTLSAETFKAHELGILGYVIDFAPVFYRNVLRKHTLHTEFTIDAVQSLPRVDILYQYLDVAPELCKAVIQSAPQAIVLAGVGDGNISDGTERLLQHAVQQGIVVVRSSRVGSGMITPHERDRCSGFLYSDNLSPQKARILLMLALTMTKDPAKIQKMFALY